MQVFWPEEAQTIWYARIETWQQSSSSGGNAATCEWPNMAEASPRACYYEDPSVNASDVVVFEHSESVYSEPGSGSLSSSSLGPDSGLVSGPDSGSGSDASAYNR